MTVGAVRLGLSDCDFIVKGGGLRLFGCAAAYRCALLRAVGKYAQRAKAYQQQNNYVQCCPKTLLRQTPHHPIKKLIRLYQYDILYVKVYHKKWILSSFGYYLMKYAKICQNTPYRQNKATLSDCLVQHVEKAYYCCQITQNWTFFGKPLDRVPHAKTIHRIVLAPLLIFCEYKRFRTLRSATRASPLDPTSLWKGLTETFIFVHFYLQNRFFYKQNKATLSDYLA